MIMVTMVEIIFNDVFPKKEKVSHLIRDGSDVSIYVLEKFKAKMAFYEKFLRVIADSFSKYLLFLGK